MHTQAHTETRGSVTSLIKNEILTFETKWMKLEIIMLSEINQTQKAEYHFLLFVAADVYIMSIKICVNVTSFSI